MALPAVVLVHGAVHAADCWDLTVDEMRRLAPELTVLAVDLPGRRGKSRDLATLTIADWVESVKSQRRSIDAIGGVQTIIEMDTCHDLMVSEPMRLAEILIERCRRYA